MQPNPDYKAAEVFLKNYCEELGLEYSSYECVEGSVLKKFKTELC